MAKRTRSKRRNRPWAREDAVALFLLVVLSWALRALLVNDGLFHHDAVCLAESVEASEASGRLVPLRLQEPPVGGRHGLVLVYWAFYELAVRLGQTSAESTLLFVTTLFGALSVGAAFGLARELGSSRSVAVVAATLLSLSPVFLSETVGAKGHGLALFMALAGTWLAHTSARHGLWAGAALSGICLAAVGFVRVPVMAAVIAALPAFFTLRKKERSPLLASFLLAFAVTAGAVAVVAWEWITRFATVTDPHGVEGALLGVALRDVAASLTPVGLLLVVAGAVSVARERAWWGLVLWMLLAFAYAASLGQYASRFLIEPLAVAVLLVARGLEVLTSRWRPAFFIAAVLLAAVPFVRTWPVIAYRHDRIGNKVVGEWIHANTPAGAVVIAMDDAPFVRYYGRREALLHPVPDPGDPGGTREAVRVFASHVGTLLTAGRPVYLLKTGLSYDPDQLVSRVLSGNFDITEVARMESEDFHDRSIRSGIYEQIVYEVRLR